MSGIHPKIKSRFRGWGGRVVFEKFVIIYGLILAKPYKFRDKEGVKKSNYSVTSFMHETLLRQKLPKIAKNIF